MQSWKNSHNFGDGDRCTNETWSTGRAMAYGYDDAHQLTSVDATRPSDAARYRYDAAEWVLIGLYTVILTNGQMTCRFITT